MLTLVLTFGAVARLTRLITDDALTEGLRGRWRAWWIRRYGPDHPRTRKAALFVSCPWCMSVWVAAALVPAANYAGRSAWFMLPAAALSISYVYAITAAHLDD